MTGEERIKQNHDAIDLMRVFLAAGVVMLHILWDVPGVINQFLHVPVTVFFVISSYLFFRRFHQYDADRPEQNRVLKGFLWRHMRLYLCWGLLQAPLTLKFLLEDWAHYGYSAWRCILDVLRRFFLGSTFFASWYLMGMMLGMLLIVLLSRKLSNFWLLLLSLASYLFCRLPSYHGLFFNPSNSFLEALLWIVLGKLIAERHPFFEKFRRLRNNQKFLVLVSFVILYCAEYFLCLRISSLAPMKVVLPFLSAALFLVVLDSPAKIPGAKRYRTVSTVTYCAHGTVYSLLIALGNRIGLAFDVMPYDLLTCALTILICAAVGACMHMLKEKNHFHWLAWFC